MSVMLHRCQNCEYLCPTDALEPLLHHVGERVSEGEVFPFGLCPDCGACVGHPHDADLAAWWYVSSKLINAGLMQTVPDLGWMQEVMAMALLRGLSCNEVIRGCVWSFCHYAELSQGCGPILCYLRMEPRNTGLIGYHKHKVSWLVERGKGGGQQDRYHTVADVVAAIAKIAEDDVKTRFPAKAAQPA